MWICVWHAFESGISIATTGYIPVNNQACTGGGGGGGSGGSDDVITLFSGSAFISLFLVFGF